MQVQAQPDYDLPDTITCAANDKRVALSWQTAERAVHSSLDVIHLGVAHLHQNPVNTLLPVPLSTIKSHFKSSQEPRH